MSEPLLSLSIEDAARALIAENVADKRIAIDPETVEHDLARLVLALIEFLRQVLELQAVRRMEAGRLTEEEEERVGLALMRARDKVRELAAQFGLTEADLALRLGPLGRLT